MGKRGPKPTPTAVLQARNSWRGNRNRAEPQYDGSTPECPDWLLAQAKEYWAKLVPWLTSANVLRRPDENALARYCQMLARWRKAEEFIAKNGDSYPVKSKPDKDGRPTVIGFRPFPQVRIASDLSAQCARFEAEFGLTPASRSRIVTDPPAGADQNPAAEPKPKGPPKLRIAS